MGFHYGVWMKASCQVDSRRGGAGIAQKSAGITKPLEITDWQ